MTSLSVMAAKFGFRIWIGRLWVRWRSSSSYWVPRCAVGFRTSSCGGYMRYKTGREGKHEEIVSSWCIIIPILFPADFTLSFIRSAGLHALPNQFGGGDRWLYVNVGLGSHCFFGEPIRFFCDPEITLITLQRKHWGFSFSLHVHIETWTKCNLLYLRGQGIWNFG